MCVDHVCRSYILKDSFLFIAFHVCSCCLVSCRVASWHVYWIRRQLSHVQCRNAVDRNTSKITAAEASSHLAGWAGGAGGRGVAVLDWSAWLLGAAWLPRSPAGLALDPTTTSNKKRRGEEGRGGGGGGMRGDKIQVTKRDGKFSQCQPPCQSRRAITKVSRH